MESMVIIIIWIIKEFHKLMFFGFSVTCVEEEEDDEENSLS